MSLTSSERVAVMAQVLNTTCSRCGDELTAKDDGVSSETEWGVSGAYVSCDTCGLVLNKEAE